jgi:uncharacterized membrane protein YbhN (UPF0104 family)
MLKSLRFYLTIALGVILYLFLLFKFLKEIKNTDFSPLFSIINLILIILCFIITILLIFSRALFLKKIFKIFNVQVDLNWSIDSWLISVSTGVFTAGISMAILIFDKFKKLNKSNSESFLLIFLYYFLCMFPVFFMLFIFFFNKITLVLFLIFFIILLLLMRILQILLNGRTFLKEFFYAILISFISEIIYLLIFWISFNIVGLSLNPIFILKAFVIAQLSSTISLTSSGLGITEPLTIYYISLYNLNMAKIILFIFLYRFFTFWIPVFWGVFILIRKNNG